MICFCSFIEAIIGGISTTICGMRPAIRWISGTKVSKSSDIRLMPSRASNTDRSAQHIGISKQCFSQ
ncbi:Uncharacterised protein [Mycobacteroides abscessus subsp. abscessus]|nr:Uncharacterised protein [Mycobacteroides abscessus subsp. abscessus]